MRRLAPDLPVTAPVRGLGPVRGCAARAQVQDRGAAAASISIAFSVIAFSVKAARTTMRTGSCAGSESATSHSQQSLQRWHLSQIWLLHASLVQRTQIRVDSSPQMLQVKGMAVTFSFLVS